MRAAANHYGSNHGTQADEQTFVEVFEWMTDQFAQEGYGGERWAGPQVAKETAGSPFPIAVEAAWAVAALLPHQSLKQLAERSGYSGYVKAASMFDAVLPGQLRTSVLGRAIPYRVLTGAVAGALLIALGVEDGLIEEDALHRPAMLKE